MNRIDPADFTRETFDKTPPTRAEIADIMIEALNKLLEDEHTRKDIAALMLRSVSASPQTVVHPTIQVDGARLSVLGLLNGSVGVVEAGPRKGWGLITAVYDNDGVLARFERTQEFVPGAEVWYTDPEAKLPQLRGLHGTVRNVEGTVAMVEFADSETCSLKDFALPLKDLRHHVPS